MVCLLGLPTTSSHGAPKADPWPQWEANDPASRLSVDHQIWQAFLDHFRVVGEDGIARVRYGAVSLADRLTLWSYLTKLSHVQVDALNRDEQRAFWINLYNALTVRVVLEHYPVSSIKDIRISPGLFAEGPWQKPLITIEGTALSLDDIEHRILRPIWQDPRIHYALNCAALGCPNLAADAYGAKTAEAMLDAAARAYVNSPRGARLDSDGLTLSRIYDWYQADFGGSEGAVIAHLKTYAAPALATALAASPKIVGYQYDWRLNEAP